MLDLNGTLYGTTYLGGASGNGVVYSVTTTGVEKVVYNFKGGTDGGNPIGGLIDVNGTLYGTTSQGGDSACYSGKGCGTFYAITTSGSETVLYRFAGGPGDGSEPTHELVDVNGTLYGTTFVGGSHGRGAVYTISTSGSENLLYSFAGGPSDGQWPFGSLLNVNGTLYGTAENGGSSGDGTLFSITTGGSEKVLYNFTGGADGQTPVGSLTDLHGTLYGATAQGGGSGCYVEKGSVGCGTAYGFSGTGAETVLHRFASGSDGAGPAGGFAQINGTLYGATVFGGGSGCFRLGCGTVFALTP